MALPTLIEDKDKTWIFKVITQTPEPELNVCLMGFFLGSGMKTLETTLRLIETDTVSMVAIADMAF